MAEECVCPKCGADLTEDGAVSALFNESFRCISGRYDPEMRWWKFDPAYERGIEYNMDELTCVECDEYIQQDLPEGVDSSSYLIQ